MQIPTKTARRIVPDNVNTVEYLEYFAVRATVPGTKKVIIGYLRI